MAARKRYLFACVATVFGAGFMLGSTVRGTSAVQAQSANRVFELRTYTTPEGRLDDLQAGFRDNTMRLFERHGMTNVGYWTPQDAPNSSNTLVYITRAQQPRSGRDRPPIVVPPTVLVQRPPEAWGEGR